MGSQLLRRETEASRAVVPPDCAEVGTVCWLAQALVRGGTAQTQNARNGSAPKSDLPALFTYESRVPSLMNASRSRDTRARDLLSWCRRKNFAPSRLRAG